MKEVSDYILKRLDQKSPIVKQKASFIRGRQYLYGADNMDFELQSDQEDLVKEKNFSSVEERSWK